MKKKNVILSFLLLQLSVVIYSSAGICGKLATKYPMLSLEFMLYFAGEFAILAIYAILWQQIIKKIDLFVAYANKGTSILWSILWAILIFEEKITVFNIIGVIVVMAGVLLITSDSIGGDQ